jgi:hypothetical protein
MDKLKEINELFFDKLQSLMIDYYKYSMSEGEHTEKLKSLINGFQLETQRQAKLEQIEEIEKVVKDIIIIKNGIEIKHYNRFGYLLDFTQQLETKLSQLKKELEIKND